MSEDKYQKAINDASQARDLLNSPLLKEALDYLDGIYTKEVMESDKPDSAAWYMARAHKQFVQHLYRVLDGGRIAKNDLELISKRRARQAA